MFGALSLYEKNSRWLRVETRTRVIIINEFRNVEFRTQKGIFEYSSLKLKIIIPFDVYIYFCLNSFCGTFSFLLQNTGQI